MGKVGLASLFIGYLPFMCSLCLDSKMIVALIPARSGSKRVKDKNIRPLGGYPLMAWSIACAKMLTLDVYVSSDSEHYLKLAEFYGAFSHLRQSGYSDMAKDTGYINDFKRACDVETDIMLLRPTTPLRSLEFLTTCDYIYGQCNYSYHVVSLCEMRDGDFYRNTGQCEIFQLNRFNQNKIGVLQEHEVGEIDEEEDFDYIEWRLAKYGSPILDYLKTNYSNPK